MTVKPKAKPRGKPFVKGKDERRSTTGGRKKSRESITAWMENFLGMTAVEVADTCAQFAKDFKRFGSDVPIAAAIAARSLLTLLNDTDARLFSVVLDRTEGKVMQPVEMTIWQASYAEAIRAKHLTLSALESQFGSDGARRILADIVSGGYLSGAEVKEKLGVALADNFFNQATKVGE